LGSVFVSKKRKNREKGGHDTIPVKERRRGVWSLGKEKAFCHRRLVTKRGGAKKAYSKKRGEGGRNCRLRWLGEED